MGDKNYIQTGTFLLDALLKGGIPKDKISAFVGQSTPPTKYFEMVSVLYYLRSQRDKEPHGEIRSLYNTICDKLDVLVSKMLQNNEQEKEQCKETQNCDTIQEFQAKGRSERNDQPGPGIDVYENGSTLCNPDSEEKRGYIE